MDGDEESVVVLAEDDEGSAQQRPASEVERAAALCARQAPQLGFTERLGQTPQIEAGERGGTRREDDLHGVAAGRPEHRAQRLVAGRQPGEGTPQGRDVEAAPQAHGSRQVVRRAGRVELLQEPHAFLGKGQRDPLAQLLPRDRHEGRQAQPRLLFPRRFQDPGQGAHGGSRKMSVIDRSRPSASRSLRGPAPPAASGRRGRRSGPRAPPGDAPAPPGTRRRSVPPPRSRGGRIRCWPPSALPTARAAPCGRPSCWG